MNFHKTDNPSGMLNHRSLKFDPYYHFKTLNRKHNNFTVSLWFWGYRGEIKSELTDFQAPEIESGHYQTTSATPFPTSLKWRFPGRPIVARIAC